MASLRQATNSNFFQIPLGFMPQAQGSDSTYRNDMPGKYNLPLSSIPPLFCSKFLSSPCCVQCRQRGGMSVDEASDDTGSMPNAAQELRQCRFCLEIDGSDMVSPCACSGSSKYVHEACLRRWRCGNLPRARKMCHVCAQPWSTPAPPRVQELFVRSVRTAQQYTPPADEQRLSSQLEGQLRQLIVVGSLIVQTQSRADLFDASTAQHDREPRQSQPEAASQTQHIAAHALEPTREVSSDVRPSDPEPISRQEIVISRISQLRSILSTAARLSPRERSRDRSRSIDRQRRHAFIDRSGSSNTTVRSLVAAVIRARGLRHWHRGVFVILMVTEGVASDGSDRVVACNLTRETSSFATDTDIGQTPNEDGRRTLRPHRLRWLQSAARALRDPRVAAEVSTQSDSFRGTHIREGGSRPEANHSVEEESSTSDDEIDHVRRANKALCELRALGVQVKIFRGGPKHTDEPLGLIIFSRSPAASLPPEIDNLSVLRAAVGDVEPWSCRDLGESQRAYVGAVPAIAACSRIFCGSHGWTGMALCWAGVAIWSSDQLLAEIARHSWAMSPGYLHDLINSGPSVWRSVITRPVSLAAPETDELLLTTTTEP